MQSEVRPIVPQEPLFSPAGLTFRNTSRETAGATGFDFFWARNAIFHGLRALGIQPGQKILVPAYLCTAAIEPIEYFGAEVEFYAIRSEIVRRIGRISSRRSVAMSEPSWRSTTLAFHVTWRDFARSAIDTISS